MRRFLPALALFALAGCGGDDRVGIEGSVTYAGEPVGIGTITFIPAGDKAVKAGGRIEAGRYKLDPQFGLNPGKHAVQIRWAKPTGKKYKNEFGDEYDRTEEGLPDKYHTNTTLSADVTAGGNVIDFQLDK